MLNTKAFAELCSSSKKTILHYDRIGLLKPKMLNDRGFRFYEPQQVLVFQKIQMLKDFGLKLKETKSYLKNDGKLGNLFDTQKHILEKEKVSLEKKLARISEYIENLKNKKPIVVPKIKTVKAFRFFGEDKKGRYVDINKYQQEIFAKRGEKKAVSTGLTVFYEPGYRPHGSTMTTGILINPYNSKKGGKLKIYRVPTHKAVYYTHFGPYSYLSYVWQYVNKFVTQNKLRRHPQIAEREIYLKGPLGGNKEEDCITELQIPIE